jgi:hypothetical protein
MDEMQTHKKARFPVSQARTGGGLDCLREKARKVSNPPGKAGKLGDHAGEHDVGRAWAPGFF